MKVASLFLCSFTAISGFAILSLPAVAAECWMTCPPGSASTPSAAEQQPPTAAAEPAALPDQQKPITKANVTDKSPPAASPAKKKAPPAPAETTSKSSPHTPEAVPMPVEESAPVQTKEAPATQAPPVEPAAPTAAPGQDADVQQPPQPAAAFQPAPVQEAAPPPTPIPGPVPGTATMRVIPESRSGLSDGREAPIIGSNKGLGERPLMTQSGHRSYRATVLRRKRRVRKYWYEAYRCCLREAKGKPPSKEDQDRVFEFDDKPMRPVRTVSPKTSLASTSPVEPRGRA